MKPQIGQIMKVYGKDCRIFKIHPFGTIDVVALREVAGGKPWSKRASDLLREIGEV